MEENTYLHVLILDDEVHSLQLIQSLLLPFPFIKRTTAVQSVKDAIVVIKEQAVDLLLLDIELMGESGFDLLDRISQPAFEFVCLAATKEYAYKAFEYGSSGYLLKPVNETELFACFQRLHRFRPFIQPLPPLMQQEQPPVNSLKKQSF
ncbi:MAG: response regulator [Chitinophagales bacterium]|nr:response regulator [Chitinophagales bacterium]